MNNKGGMRRLDHNLGLNFKRIPLSAEVDIIRPSVERIAELRIQRLQEQETGRDITIKSMTTFKTEGFWSCCGDKSHALNMTNQICLCQHQLELSEDIQAIDPSHLSNCLGSYSKWQRSSIESVRHQYIEPNMDEIFKHPILSGAIRSAAQDYLTDDFADIDRFSNAYGQAVAAVTLLLNEMRAKMNKVVVSVCGFALSYFLPKVFSRITVANRQIAILKQLYAGEYPVVYLMLNQSYWDLVLLHFLLWRHGLPTPFVAVDGKPRVPFVRSIFRRLGCFFYRRSLLGRNGEPEDKIYSAMLQTYVEQLLANGQPLALYLEENRSLSGRIDRPCVDLLSMVDAACVRGPVSDVCFVPVAIGYEKVPESDELTRHRMTCTGARASFSFSHLVASRPAVHIFFAPPVRLIQFRASMAHSSSPPHLPLLLAQHSLHMASSCRALFPSNLLAFFLLTRHRAGIGCPQLYPEFSKFLSLVRPVSRFGFHPSSKLNDIVASAINVLKPQLDVETAANGDLVRISPKLTSPETALGLARFAAPVVSVLGVETAKACAQLGQDKGEEAEVKSDKVAMMLGPGLLVRPPCVREEVFMGKESSVWRRLTGRDEPGSLDRHWCKVRDVGGDTDEMKTLACGAGPMLETLWLTCRAIYHRRLEDVWREEELVKEVMEEMRARMKDGKLIYVECQCSSTIRASLRNLEDCEIVKLIHADNDVFISLVDVESLLETMQFMETCLVFP